MRYRDDISKFTKKLSGVKVGIILEPDFRDLSDTMVGKEEKDRLKNIRYRERVPAFVLSHLWKKIAPTDVVYIYNKNGYIGHNTLGELFFAAGKEKFIGASDDKTLVDGKVQEVCAEILVNKVIKNPRELSTLLL